MWLICVLALQCHEQSMAGVARLSRSSHSMTRLSRHQLNIILIRPYLVVAVTRHSVGGRHSSVIGSGKSQRLAGDR